jgi:hypothetical protein
MVGEAGAEASWIEIEDEDGLAGAPIESPLGVFVVAFDGEHDATIRVLAGEDVLLEEQVSGYGPEPP